MAEADGWRLSMDGRFNTFGTFGWGNYLVQAAPDDGIAFIGGGGLDVQLQRDSVGNFATPRIRNGFVANVMGFTVTRKVTETTTLTARAALWSDIELNLQVYGQPHTYMQEGYLKLEGPWGSFLAGRALALFSRGAVEIDFNYGHGFGEGYPCNVDGIDAGCGMIGFGVLFPFFRPGLLYTTPDAGGFTLAVGMYDPVLFAGKWERIITPTFEAEAAWQRKFGKNGLFKLFASGVWERLGGRGNPPGPGGMPDTRTLATKTVDAVGGAGGLRLEVGPVRLGLAGHYGKGLGFYYALEDSEAAFYTATDSMDPRDGDLRTYRGFYGQLMLVLGKVDVYGGAGASQLVPLPFDDDGSAGDTRMNGHLPKQNLGFNGGLVFHVRDYLALDVDYFQGQFSWWWTTFTQTVHFANVGMTVLF